MRCAVRYGILLDGVCRHFAVRCAVSLACSVTCMLMTDKRVSTTLRSICGELQCFAIPLWGGHCAVSRRVVVSKKNTIALQFRKFRCGGAFFGTFVSEAERVGPLLIAVRCGTLRRFTVPYGASSFFCCNALTSLGSA